MLITGFCVPALRLFERSAAPADLATLARLALSACGASRVAVSLTSPWERALGVAANELSLPVELLAAAEGLPQYSAQVREGELILVLWDYDFDGPEFGAIRQALEGGKTVENLWQEWQQFQRMRRPARLPAAFQSSPADQHS
jgi:hypothetical protein